MTQWEPYRFPCNTCSCTGGAGNHWPRTNNYNVTPIINDVLIIYRFDHLSIDPFWSFNHWRIVYSVILSVDHRVIQLFDHSIIWSFDHSIIWSFDSISGSFIHLIILLFECSILNHSIIGPVEQSISQASIIQAIDYSITWSFDHSIIWMQTIAD